MNRTNLLVVLLVAAGCGDNETSSGPDAEPPPDPDPMVDAPPVAPPPGLRLLDHALAIDVTPDGRIAVFEDLSSGEAKAVVLDTVTGEILAQPAVGDPSRVMVTGISATRRISALHGEPVQAGVWSADVGWHDLGSPHPAGCGDAEVSGAFDISADGSVIVGLAWNGCAPDAFRWTDGTFTTLQLLGTPAPGSSGTPTNRATVIADDGSVVAGFAQNGAVDRSPAVWRQDGTGFLLDPTETDVPGEVLSISASGETLAGIWGQDGFVWTEAGGLVMLPRLDISLPSDPVYPNAISADGSRVFGGIGDAFFSIPIAFVWTAADGTRSLADVAAARGIELPAGLILNSVLGASADGTVLVGTAMDQDFAPRTFVLRL